MKHTPQIKRAHRALAMAILVVVSGLTFMTLHTTQRSSSVQLLPRKPVQRLYANNTRASQPRPAQHATAQQSSTTQHQKRYYLLNAPNDPAYPSAWYLSAVNAEPAWAITADSSSVTVAVIDTGFALDHEDLRDAWYINTGEYGGGKESDGIDNDGDGYVDDWRGWDFVANDNQPQAGTGDAYGAGVSHGTETAGLVGASTNNGIGVASISRNARILPLQVMDDAGNGYSDAVASAIDYAVAQHVQVISMSLGTSGDDPLVRAAVDRAYAAGIVVVAAAGNCGNSTAGPCAGQPSGYVTFPANYDRVVAVGATTSSGSKASFSSYGQRLDIMAPGSGTITSPAWTALNHTSAYATSLQGTSFSAPIVASAAALIRSIRPTTSVDDVRALLMGTAQKLSAMSGNFYTSSYGHGLLDIGTAIGIASDMNTSGESRPTAQQTAGAVAEHLFTGTETIGSGCQAPAATWCTTWLRNDANNYDRYLPYRQTDANGITGWTYSSSALLSGEWTARGVQGQDVSDTPFFLQKK